MSLNSPDEAKHNGGDTTPPPADNGGDQQTPPAVKKPVQGGKMPKTARAYPNLVALGAVPNEQKTS